MNQEPPTNLDSALVLCRTTTPEFFGTTEGFDGSAEEIVYLAVGRYEDAEGFYLFACNKLWQVVGDLFYEGTEDAMKDAERFYQVSPITWEKVIV